MRAWVPLGVVLFIYAAAAAAAWPLYRFQVNVDGISYISIARKYLNREWLDAVNGYWSPLFSWLLVVPLALKVPTLLAAKLVNLSLGAAALALVNAALMRLKVEARHRALLLLAAAVMVLQFAMTIITPDLLSATLVLKCLVILLGRRYWRGRGAVLLGLAIGASYLAKSYNLPFMVGIVTLVHMMMLRFRRRRSVVVRQWFIAMAVAAAVSALWVMPISRKYGKLTIGTSGGQNQRLFGPTNPQWPPFTEGLIPPPNRTAISAWEDPGYFHLPAWSPLAGRHELKHQVWLIRENGKEIVWTIVLFSAVALPAGAVALWRMRRGRGWRLGVLVIAAACYPAGYVLVCVEERYLWPLALVLLVLSGAVASRVRRRWRWPAVALVALSFIGRPLWLAWQERAELRELERIAVLADRWAGPLPRGAAVATDWNPDPQGRSHWHDVLALSFHRGLRFFGETKPDATPAEIAEDLRGHGIERFVIHRPPSELPFLAGWQRLSAPGSSPAVYAPPGVPAKKEPGVVEPHQRSPHESRSSRTCRSMSSFDRVPGGSCRRNSETDIFSPTSALADRMTTSTSAGMFPTGSASSTLVGLVRRPRTITAFCMSSPFAGRRIIHARTSLASTCGRCRTGAGKARRSTRVGIPPHPLIDSRLPRRCHAATPMQKLYRAWRYALFLLDRFKVLVLLALIVLVLSTAILWVYHPDQKNPETRKGLPEVTFGVFELMFASEPALPYPKGSVPAQIVFFILPVLNVLGLAAALAQFSAILFDPSYYNRAQARNADAHVIVCGLGRLGREVLKHLDRRHHLKRRRDVVIIENGEGVEALETDLITREPIIPVIKGNMTHARTLRDAGIARATAVMLLTGDDTTNLESALLARELNPNVRIVVRMNNTRVSERLDGMLRRGGVKRFHLVDSVEGAAPKCLALSRIELGAGGACPVVTEAIAAGGRVIICGLGRLGFGIARTLKGCAPVVVIDNDPWVDYADDPVITADPPIRIVRGDMTVKRVLQDAGVDRAAAVLVLSPNDTENLEAAMAIHELNATVRIVMRITNSRISHRLDKVLTEAFGETLRVIDPFEYVAPRFVEVVAEAYEAEAR